MKGFPSRNLSFANTCSPQTGPVGESSDTHKASRPHTGPSHPWPRWLFAAYLLFLFLSITVAVWLAVSADREGRPALRSLAPIIGEIVRVGGELTTDPTRKAWILAWSLAACAVVMIPVAVLGRGRSGIRSAVALAACASAILAQAALFSRESSWGLWLYGLAIGLILIRRLLPGSMGPGYADPPTLREENRAGVKTAPLILEAFSLGVLTLATLTYYFYALNHLPSDFEGEMSFYMAVSTSIHGALQVNYGASGTPWAPLGIFYYVLLHFAEKVCGTTLLAARVVSAVVGVILVNLLYGLLRQITCVSVAFLAAALLACNSVSIVWSRQDFFPFAYPSLFVVALVWTTWIALKTERFIYFLMTAVLMGLTYHLFPSGQTGFLIPVGVMGWYLLVTRGFFRRCWWKLTTIPAGIALWAIGLPVSGYLATGSWQWRNPFALNPGKTLWGLKLGETDLSGRVVFIIQQAWFNIVGFVKCLYLENVWPTHQTIFHGIPGHPATYVSAVVAVLLLFGFTGLLLHARRPVSMILLTWTVVSSLPGILSTQASARRLAAIFPALFGIGALAAEGGFRTLDFLFGRKLGIAARWTLIPTVVSLLFILHGGYYFSQSPAPPPSVTMARELEPYVRPGTFLVADIREDYYTAAEITYMMMDPLKRADDLAAWYLPKPEDWPMAAIRPRPDPGAWYYRYTFLKDQLPELKQRTRWDRIAYVIQDVPQNKWKIETVRDLLPNATIIEERHTPSHPWYDFVVFQTDGETLEQIQKPVVTLKGESFDLHFSSKEWWEPVSVRFMTATGVAACPVPEVSFRAALYVARQSWEGFRVVGGGDLVDFRVDNVPIPPAELVPLTEGFHRLDFVVQPPWNFPLTLESRTDMRPDFSTVTAERVAAPRVAEIPTLAAEPAFPYDGFNPPELVAKVQPGFGFDLAISPSGRVGAVGLFDDHWEVEIFAPGGHRIGCFRQSIPRDTRKRECLVTFIDDDRIAVLDWHWPAVRVHRLTGEVDGEVHFPAYLTQPLDIAANRDGDIFVTTGANHVLLHLSLRDGELHSLTRPGENNSPSWNPWKVSVSQGGPVAVLDGLGDIHLFEINKETSTRFSWSKSVPRLSDAGVPSFEIRRDGWLFLHYSSMQEVRVLDSDGRRRIALNPIHDLSRLLMYKCNRIVGIDERGNLYFWQEANGCVWRVAPKVS